MQNTKVLCNECLTITESFEMFLSLQLNINYTNSNITIIDCLNDYIKKITLKDENSFFCKKCNKLVNKGYKCMNFWNIPNILTIQLSRFNNINNITQKITNSININFNIDIKKYIDTDYLKYLETQNNCFEYILYAACCHSGSLNMGHYFAIIHYKNNWYKIDDKNVYLVNNILNVQNIINKYSYMLFYKKKIL